MTDIAAIVDKYLSAYNERDRDARGALIEQVWAVDGRPIDPPLAGEGHRAISDMAAPNGAGALSP